MAEHDVNININVRVTIEILPPVGTDTKPTEKELKSPVKKARNKGPFRL